MSEFKIKRRTRSVPITIGTSVDTADTLRVDDMAGAVISVGTMAVAAVTLDLYGSVEPEGPYRQLYQSSGNAASVTLASSESEGRIYALPDELFAVPYVKIVGDADSDGTPAVVSFKS